MHIQRGLPGIEKKMLRTTVRSSLNKEDYGGIRIPNISSDVSLIPMYQAEESAHALSFSST